MDLHHHQDSSSTHPLALHLFSSEANSSSSNKTSKDMMQGINGYFSIGQWQELEVQALIFRHMLTGSSVPPQLLNLLLNTNTNINYPCYPRSNFPPLYQTGGGYWGRGVDPEPGRCKRTDGKKWRCSRDVVAGHKYCERHIHRGRNRSRKHVEIPTPTPTPTATVTTNTAASLRGGVKAYTTVAGGGRGGGGSVHSSFDQLHLNQRIPESTIDKGAYGSSNDTKPSGGRILRPFFNDWPRTVDQDQEEVLATSLSISVPGDAASDFSLRLSTGNHASGQPREDINGESDRGPLNWGMLWGTHHAGSMGGPLAEALRSSSVSNASSPTSVLHQLQRGSSTTNSETSYVST